MATTYENNLDRLQPSETKNSVRLDLRLFVYPDGHGNIIIQNQGTNYPASSQKAAAEVLADIWNRASELSSREESRVEEGALKPELLAWLKSVGASPRKLIGPLALQQMYGGKPSTEMSEGIIAAREE